jgi:preprotein translocase subunit SecD
MMANLALVLNVLFMMGFLALIEATLTLPGMAGIVLTIGMAVDANVLIFERIREELRAGKTPRTAIDAGYKKAFGTIFDSNVTTMIAGVVLMQYGSGPVRGFAVTLIIGLTCSLYTAIVVTRMIYDLITSRRRLESLSI